MAYNGNNKFGGNPVRQTDEYGNPIHHTGQTMGEYGAPGNTGGGAYPAAYAGTAATTEGYETVTTGGYGTRNHGGTGTTGGYGTHGGTGTTGGYGTHGGSGTTGGYDTHATSGMDQHGRREEKGVKENVTEKLTGGGHREEGGHGQAHPTTGYGGHGGGLYHEKRGIMDKIKDCLPGNH